MIISWDSCEVCNTHLLQTWSRRRETESRLLSSLVLWYRQRSLCSSTACLSSVCSLRGGSITDGGRYATRSDRRRLTEFIILNYTVIMPRVLAQNPETAPHFVICPAAGSARWLLCLPTLPWPSGPQHDCTLSTCDQTQEVDNLKLYNSHRKSQNTNWHCHNKTKFCSGQLRQEYKIIWPG